MNCPMQQLSPELYERCKQNLGTKDDQDVTIFWILSECNCADGEGMAHVQ
jgi:hypothetical protein